MHADNQSVAEHAQEVDPAASALNAGENLPCSSETSGMQPCCESNNNNSNGLISQQYEEQHMEVQDLQAADDLAQMHSHESLHSVIISRISTL